MSDGSAPPLKQHVSDEVQSAIEAGLRYTIPSGVGVRRRVSGSGYTYLDTNDRRITDERTLSRIGSLVIPPAWTSVWISPHANAHIQAVGRDAKGRKQYRYHTEYRAARDLVKFDRMLAFGKVLRRIRRAVDRDLKRRGMPKRKVLAAIVRLLESTFIRIGNEEYVEENNSFGLTTLRNRHVEVLGGTIKFKFRGKSGQSHEIKLEDRRLAAIVKRCHDLPGSSLFEYLDNDGSVAHIESGDVNDYIREISGGEFTAKDFRTWGGTCLAANYLLCQLDAAQDGQDPTVKQVKQTLVDVVKQVACKLGNKPATCKKYYIHPTVLDSFSAGTLRNFAEKFRDNTRAYRYEDIVLAILAPLKQSRAARTRARAA